MKRNQIILSFMTLALLAGGLWYWRLTSEPPSPNEAAAEAVIPVAMAESAEEKERRKLLGVWQDEYQGKRTMTLNADGSGTMIIELSGLKATFFGSKLRFDMNWSLSGKTLFMKTMGGEPADKVNLILKMAGNTGADTILELTDNRLFLLDRNGHTKYDWRRAGMPGN